MPALSLPRRDEVTPYLLGVALLPVCALFAWGGYIDDPNPLNLLVHSWNLIVHEAGHFFFRFFGDLAHTAGGSVLQLALPALFVYQGVYWDSAAGTQLALLLLGQNFVDVSIYAADAQARVLPLLGGDGVFHDWHRLLSTLDLLAYTPQIAGALFGAAFVCWGVMLVVPRWVG